MNVPRRFTEAFNKTRMRLAPVPGERVNRPPSSPSTAITTTSPIETVSFRDLPPSIFRYIHKRLSAKREEENAGESSLPQITAPGETTPLTRIDNPFLLHRYPVYSPSAPPEQAATSRWYQHISKRNQKRLLKHYEREVLPPSAVNNFTRPPRISWIDGTELVWGGEVQFKERKPLYGNRRVMFKGRKNERVRKEIIAEVEGRMEGMEARIAKWRATKKEEESKSRPSLPF